MPPQPGDGDCNFVLLLFGLLFGLRLQIVPVGDIATSVVVSVTVSVSPADKQLLQRLLARRGSDGGVLHAKVVRHTVGIQLSESTVGEQEVGQEGAPFNDSPRLLC